MKVLDTAKDAAYAAQEAVQAAQDAHEAYELAAQAANDDALAAAHEMAGTATDADPESEDITDSQDLSHLVMGVNPRDIVGLGSTEPVPEPPPDPRL